MITIRVIGEERKADIRLLNEPFPLVGRMLPSYSGGRWQYEVIRRDEGEMCFPDEDYSYEAMHDSSIFLGAYDGERCVGLAILQQAMLRYMYLYDLKVVRSYRHAGVGTALMHRAREVARANGYRGIYTQGQDNNLLACLFYLKTGFRIGGVDTDVYRGTSQEGTSDIIFYWDAD